VTRALRQLLVVALAGTLALAGCAGRDPDATDDAASSTSTSARSTTSSTSEAAPTTPEGPRIEVYYGVGGEVTGDTGRVPVPLGETVTLVVETVAPDQVHVHGYDLTAEVSPFSPAQFTFEATLPGVFEVELHDAGAVLLTLQVE
jgi:hypothetical protein